MTVREDGRTINVAWQAAVAVNAEGYREVLGLDMVSDEDVARMAGVPALADRQRAVRCAYGPPDTHRGLVNAIAATLSGASWQRCRTPSPAQPFGTRARKCTAVGGDRGAHFDQPDPGEVRAQFGRVVNTIGAKYPDAATHLDDVREDQLAFTAFPHEVWRQVWLNNPQGRLNKAIRRPHRRGRHLPQPGRDPPPRWRSPGQADRR